jgi:hypothetical protein
MKRDRTSFEVAILVGSLVAIVAIIAGLVISALGYESGPAKLETSLARGTGRHDYVLTVKNEGGATAEEVRVLVRRGRGSVEVEFRAVPKGDAEEALVTIGGTGRPTARVQSYKEP